MNHPLTIDEERQLACALAGVRPEQLLKVRATADSLVVIIHTGQKFIYGLAAIGAALEKLALEAGRLAADLNSMDREETPAGQPPARGKRRGGGVKGGGA
jgi:hypothetical protein